MLTQSQLHVLHQCSLFRNVSLEELNALLPCLNTTIKHYLPDTLILTQETQVNYVYIILEGQVEISKSNFEGSKNIMLLLSTSQLFGEGIVCTRSRCSPITATALSPTTLLLIPYNRIIGGCEHGCSFHHSLIHNMMLILGEKNYQLNIKMDLLLIKGMREKLLTYLRSQSRLAQSASFTLPMNRNQLADYLNVSRPSMCRELKRMKDEGLIDYYQNSFKLL